MISGFLYYSNGSFFPESSEEAASESNSTSLSQVELPYPTGSDVWLRVFRGLSVSITTDTSMILQPADRNQIGGMFAHCLCFWGPELMKILKNAQVGIQPDPHWKVREMVFIFISDFIGYLLSRQCKSTSKYHSGGIFPFSLFPLFVASHLLMMTFIILSCSRSYFSPSGTDHYDLVFLHCGTAAWRYVIWLVILLQYFMTICKALTTPFSQIFYACYGIDIHTEQLMKLIGGLIVPRYPIANLYVCVYLLRVLSISLHFSLKCGVMTLLDILSHLQ